MGKEKEKEKDIKIYELKSLIPEQEIAKLEGTYFDESYFDLIIK